jgi:uncharacterized protein YndB with AHSA1/START domain/DNA-binding transcriptional ArsR family regulator
MELRPGLDDVFKALADPSRRQLLDALRAQNGQTLRQLCGGLDMTRQSVSKHLAVLEQSNLVTTTWQGREKLHFLNAAPINDIADRWINQYHRERVQALADLKHALEGTPMPAPGPEFVYTTYIHTTPEQLWRALTEPAFTRRYWFGVTFESTWRPGDTIKVTYEDGTVVADPEQVVLESDPYRRLAYTWFTSPHTTDDHSQEPRSKVSFDLEAVEADLVKLTVVHDGFASADSPTFTSISGGWPRVLSNLKTLLETPAPTA